MYFLPYLFRGLRLAVIDQVCVALVAVSLCSLSAPLTPPFLCYAP